MSRLFLDTGYLIALEAADDQHHTNALRHWRELLPWRPQLVTISFVLDEVAVFFNRRGRHTKAVEIGERLLASPSCTVRPHGRGAVQAAWSYFGRRADKRFSLTDRVSFVLMERLGIESALAFDAHLLQAGFRILP